MDITNEEELDSLLSEPSPALVTEIARIDGDIAILGIGGKIGPTLGRMAARAVDRAGVDKAVYGVSRFSEAGLRKKLDSWGVESVSCDLLDRDSVAKLPDARNVIFMAGRKFGTSGGGEATTWAMNAVLPSIVADRYRNGRIVVFSTGCVYPLVGAAGGGSVEADRPEPVGEYAQSCLARERVFEYGSGRHGTPVLLFRLNYAIDLRYGVLHDIAMSVWEGRPVDNSVGEFNAIWQGDVNDWALRCLEHCTSPPTALNVTGPEVEAVSRVAGEFGRIMGKQVRYTRPVPGKAGYLSNAARALSMFGRPRVSMDEMIRLQAEWVMAGGRSLGKPTHFEVSTGEF
ncbi:MAG: NAD(P)-dependent oxidoreductase [Candidatus Lokiarchaeota archaeon]|nr:NAD(P)-dependent oxidoreductase [Candidatus Lokiarchaeota archaeon]